jgi:hypothetical protein
MPPAEMAPGVRRRRAGRARDPDRRSARRRAAQLLPRHPNALPRHLRPEGEQRAVVDEVGHAVQALAARAVRLLAADGQRPV